jgi:hypothetical protein
MFSPAAWLASAPAVLTVVGVIMFGVLTIAYSQFYGRLGLSPDTVGLGYVNALIRSSGLVMLIALAAPPLVMIAIRRTLERQTALLVEELHEEQIDEFSREGTAVAGERAEIEREMAADLKREREQLHRWMSDNPDPSTRKLVEDRLRQLDEAEEFVRTTSRVFGESRARIRSLVDSVRRVGRAQALRRSGRWARRSALLVFLVLLLIVGAGSLLAVPLANDVRAGKEVNPVRVLGLTILDIRAKRATVEPVNANAAPGLALLGRGRLLHLGKADGTVVFFDPEQDEAVQVPASAVVVRTTAHAAD